MIQLYFWVRKMKLLNEIFGTFSGLCLNRNKTEGIWIGKLKNSREKIGGISWTDKHVKALGICFGLDKEECSRLNWESRIDKMKRILKSWENRNLSIIGKKL